MSGDYKTVDTQLFRYYDVGKSSASWKTLYISRELKFAKGVYSRSRDGSQTGGTFSTLTTVVDEQPTTQLSSMIGDYNFTKDALGAGAIAGTFTLLGLGYLHFKRRAWDD